MTIVLALGLNLWIVAAALPLALGLHSDATMGVGLLLLSLLAPTALLLGLWQRSPVALFAAVPLFVALPLCLQGADTSARVLPPLAFVPQALSLAAYLVAVARALSGPRPSPSPSSRGLTKDALPARWRRRLRVYRGMVATAIVFPSVLLAAIDLSPSLPQELGPHAPRIQALTTVAGGLLWIGILRAYLLGPLYAHLQHDRDLLGAMELDRRHARRGRPRPAFYLAVVVALAAMIAVVWQRAR